MGDWDEDGALRAALSRTAEGLGLVLPEADRRPGRDFFAEYVDAQSGRRAVAAPPRTKGRSFEVSLQDRHTRLAHGGTADLAKVVRAAAAWTGGAGLEETKARAPFIRFRPWALVHEREPFVGAELVWRIKLDRVHMPPYNRHPRAHALLEAAYAQPVLRRLMPVNSHFDLWFSTRIGEPWKANTGYVIGLDHDGPYSVRKDGEVVARTESAEEAVALVVAALPEGLGPAR
ncbi:DUF6193 family natural product biosynthesis protein [Kitasatospora sp. NPDC057500]|uniref:DUF6193 family natural product biosynthesis protein n=1 Tax=Kitasatospora sp. NPDC057500 TaxID=3346151 RepID=UPI00369F3F4C